MTKPNPKDIDLEDVVIEGKLAQPGSLTGLHEHVADVGPYKISRDLVHPFVFYIFTPAEDKAPRCSGCQAAVQCEHLRPHHAAGQQY